MKAVIKRCPRCGELCVGRFNSLCLSCYVRAAGAASIAKFPSPPSSGDRTRTLAFRSGTGLSSERSGVVVRGG